LLQLTKPGKICQITLNIPKSRKIYQYLPSQDRPKFTQIVIFGLKTNHLATQIPWTANFIDRRINLFCVYSFSKKLCVAKILITGPRGFGVFGEFLNFFHVFHIFLCI
jgi:hypothetical protein